MAGLGVGGEYVTEHPAGRKVTCHRGVCLDWVSARLTSEEAPQVFGAANQGMYHQYLGTSRAHQQEAAHSGETSLECHPHHSGLRSGENHGVSCKHSPDA